MIKFLFPLEKARSQKKKKSHFHLYENKNLDNLIGYDFSWIHLRSEIVGQPTRPKSKEGRKSAGRHGQGEQIPDNPEHTQLDTSKNSEQLTWRPGVQWWERVKPLRTEAIKGGCKGSLVSKNHEETSPYDADLEPG